MDNQQQQQMYYKEQPQESTTTQSISLFKSQQQDTIKWMLDPQNEIDQFRRSLSGIKVINGEEKEFSENRRMNDLGVNYIIGKLEMVFSKITPLSNMTEEEIYKDTLEWTKHLIYECYKNTEKWQIGNLKKIEHEYKIKYDKAKDCVFFDYADCYVTNFKSYDYTQRGAIIYDASSLYFKLCLRAKGALQLRQLNESMQRQEKVIYGNYGGEKQNAWWEFWKSNRR